jgi:hypothetical protein
MIDRVQFNSGACTGADASGAATAYSPHVSGKVLAVAVTYAGDKPNTTDVLLADEGDPLAESIVTLANAVTDVKLYPRRATVTNANAAIAYTGTSYVYEPYVVFGRLKLTVAGANTDDVITVTVWVEE